MRVAPVTCFPRTRGIAYTRDKANMPHEFLGPGIIPGIHDIETCYIFGPLWFGVVGCEGRSEVRFNFHRIS